MLAETDRKPSGNGSERGVSARQRRILSSTAKRPGIGELEYLCSENRKIPCFKFKNLVYKILRLLELEDVEYTTVASPTKFIDQSKVSHLHCGS